MGNVLFVPDPQHRYLEPFKNRVFQYDTKHSNLFLSHYVNQVLNAVGNDVVVRGLEVTPNIDAYRTGVEFNINPGALIQDLTYFEIPVSCSLHVEDIVNFPDWYVIIYTNWRYLQTVYENDLRIEATFYNPQTRKSITGWDSSRNRIILGVFNPKVVDGEVTFVDEIKDNIFFEDSNIIQNGTFDEKTHKFWTAINSTVKVSEEAGIFGTPYLEVTPIADNYQGIAQSISTKIGYTYEVTFYLRSNYALPFEAIVLDGGSIYNMTAPQVASYLVTADQEWTEHSFRFTAISNKSTIYFLKRSESFDEGFEIDNIYCIEYAESRKQTEINKIKIIDGGRLDAKDFQPEIPDVPLPPEPPGPDVPPPDEPDIPVDPPPYIPPIRETTTTFGITNYPIDLAEPDTGKILVFYGAELLSPTDYKITPNLLTLNFSPQETGIVITIAIIDGEIEYTQTVDGVNRYTTTGSPVAYDNDMLFLGACLVADVDCTVRNSYVSFEFDIDESENYITIARLNANIWTGVSVANTDRYKCSIFGTREEILVFYGGSLLCKEDYSLNGNYLTLNGVETSDNYITVVNLGEANQSPEHISTVEIFNTSVNEKEYRVMVSPYNNILFYDASLLNTDDYTISSNSISLKFLPEVADVKMTFVGFSGITETAYTVPGKTEYSTVHTEGENYLVFYGPSLLNSNDYTLGDGTIKFNFNISEPARYTIIKVDGEVKRVWATIGETEYDCDITLEQNMVFFGDSLLQPSDYALVNDKVILSFIPESMVQITVVNYGS